MDSCRNYDVGAAVLGFIAYFSTPLENIYFVPRVIQSHDRSSRSWIFHSERGVTHQIYLPLLVFQHACITTTMYHRKHTKNIFL